MGRLQAKVMGGTVDTTSYSYNVRSWLTSIASSHFTENLYYETNSASLPDFSNAYNGDIAGIQWSIPAENLKYNRAYTFGYDGLNRLTDGTYCGWSGSVAAGTSGQYTETYSYDKMGNITNFVRYGLQSNTPAMSYGMIDNLTLAHNGNQLTKVTDNGSDGLYYGDEEYQVNTANSGNCRAYDANGNTLYDTNSDIWGIRYNLLNLPDTIQFYQGHQILYHYSATGTKQEVTDKTCPGGVTIPVTNLDTVLTNPTVLSTITTDYLGNAVYRNDTLLRILLPTGYWQGNTCYYYLKDHLGSNREVLSQTRQVVEYSDYYPSGMRFGESVVNGGNVQPYRHTGMEMQGMHGLNWIDNEARMRSVNVPEFTTIDPLAEMYYGISPYGYCADNPIYYVDPDGMTVVYDSKSNSYTIKGDDIYAYWGYLQDINNGTGSMENMLKACNAAAQGYGNGENGTNLPTTENEVTVIGQAPKSYNQHSNTSDQGHSWLYPFIGDLDGNRELDSRINRYIPSPEEIRREVDAEMEIGLLFLPTDVVGIAASTLVKMGYSATEQFLLKSILYAMEYPKATARIGGLAAGYAQYFLGNALHASLSADSPQPSMNPTFDFYQQLIQVILGANDIHNEINKTSHEK
ncbi:RHS repeat domain-containing protein [Microbacter margulisiae]|uniref:RHS repeat-associated protein n=1 Tax=Microbacter margulisiae TaxID=1350067 RepID=A0A7W5DSC8_9PORP|nr:RHS repeat-associated core domain-containing protein [Microbacter margulisiae]MBB3187868.1 RHS repeat-associated protein [Microbacter margulisiae]